MTTLAGPTMVEGLRKTIRDLAGLPVALQTLTIKGRTQTKGEKGSSSTIQPKVRGLGSAGGNGEERIGGQLC